MRRERRERFPHRRLQRESLVSDPGYASRHVRDAPAVMHVGTANSRLRGKRSRHYRRMRNPQFYVSGKKPMIIRANRHAYSSETRNEACIKVPNIP